MPELDQSRWDLGSIGPVSTHYVFLTRITHIICDFGLSYPTPPFWIYYLYIVETCTMAINTIQNLIFCPFYKWDIIVIIMSKFVAIVVITTTSGAANVNKTGVLTTLDSRWSMLCRKNVGVNGGTGDCRYDSLLYRHNCRQSWHYDDSRVSVIVVPDTDTHRHFMYGLCKTLHVRSWFKSWYPEIQIRPCLEVSQIEILVQSYLNFQSSKKFVLTPHSVKPSSGQNFTWNWLFFFFGGKSFLILPHIQCHLTKWSLRSHVLPELSWSSPENQIGVLDCDAMRLSVPPAV